VRVYEPDKRQIVINDALKDLYILKQAIDHQSGTVDSRIKLVDMIRNKLQNIISSTK